MLFIILVQFGCTLQRLVDEDLGQAVGLSVAISSGWVVVHITLEVYTPLDGPRSLACRKQS